MRKILFVSLACLLALPAGAQQLSPMTGTTATPPTAPVTPPVHAPRAPRMGLQKRFETANTTHDGKLTLEQAKAGHMPQVAQNFDAIDTGHKGYVTVADITAYRKAARAARKAAAKP